MNNYLNSLEKRRSQYALGSTLPITDFELKALLERTIYLLPSAFNTQSPRTVLLLEKHHKRLWQIVLETLRKIVPENKFASTEEKIAAFAAAYGTILFFDDSPVIEKTKQQFPLFSEAFDDWTLEHNGMHQFAIWTALADNSIGASLQHYNPLIDDAVKKEWDLPSGWRLLAQMPFGNILEPAEEKEHELISNRFFVYD